MSKFLLIPVLAIFSSISAQAAYIQQGSLDESRGVIRLVVNYGGCSKQEFRLELQDTLGTSNPPKLAARLLSEPTGPCRMAFLEVLEFPLAESGLDLEHLRGGSLTILGDNDSSATVHFPDSSETRR